MRRGLLQALALAVTLPYALLALWFLMVGEVARARGLWNVLDVMLSQALRIAEWGLYAAAAAVFTLLIAGFLPATQRLAAGGLAILAGGSLVIILALGSGPMEWGQWLFLIPLGLGLAISLALMRPTARADKEN